MKTLRLTEMMLVSFREKKARRVKFGPAMTIIRGANETGKSSLIKSIVQCFGAEPAKVHPNWREAEVRSVVRFDIAGAEYSLLRYGQVFAAFNSSGQLLGRFNSVTNELAPFLSGLLDFGLALPNRQGATVPLPPAYYLLPFYMDQDSSWTNNWSAFSRLEQFPKWRKSVIEYHAGIRGNEYYAAQALKREANEEIQHLRRRNSALGEVSSNLFREMGLGRFNIEMEVFTAELDELLGECDDLLLREESLRVELAELRNRRQILDIQRAIATQARNEMHGDFDHACAMPDDEIACPTCGAHYANSFAERFMIAVDEDRCARLALEIADEISAIDSAIADELANFRRVEVERIEIERLLATRQSDAELGDLIRQEGRNELRAVVKNRVANLEDSERLQARVVADAEKLMKSLDNKAHRREVHSFYEGLMRKFLLALDVHSVPESTICKVDGRIHDTGSELPRALLAAQFAFYHVVTRYGTSVVAPLIIDSPNQQDQDDKHLEKILTFVRDHRPADTQMILGLVDAPGISFEGTEVYLANKYSLLLADEFADVSDEIQHYVDLAISV